LVILCAVCVFPYTSSRAADLVSVKDGAISVNLKDNSLLEVARDIEKQSGVWFKGDETLFQEKISVTFTHLSLEEGLKRILTNLNYSLMFDDKNKVAGVMLVGEGTPAGSQQGRPGAQLQRGVTPSRTSPRPTPTVRSRPSTSSQPAATVRRPPGGVSPQPSQGGPATLPSGTGAAQSALPEAFRSRENVPALGNSAASDGPLPPAFRVIENAPPPGGPVSDKEIPEEFKVIRNAPPPGTIPQTGTNPGGSTPATDAPSSGEMPGSGSTP
jgi:hypothetical protein